MKTCNGYWQRPNTIQELNPTWPEKTGYSEVKTALTDERVEAITMHLETKINVSNLEY